MPCSWRSCGHCGRCDDDPELAPPAEDDLYTSACAVCEGPIGLLRVTVGGVGRVCSAKCADVAVNLSMQLERIRA